MISIGVKSNIAQMTRAFERTMGKQIPFATSLALNRIAELAKPALQSNMAVVFDRPKPFVVNSLFIKRATKSNLIATIFHSDKVAPYLKAEIVGGDRSEKPFELKVAGSSGVLVPTNNVKKDSYGGVSKALVARILSQARDVSDRTAEYVIIRPGQSSKLAAGIYLRKNGSIIALFFFKNKTSYQARYDMEGVVQRVVQAEFDRQFAASMDYALSTAKVSV